MSLLLCRQEHVTHPYYAEELGLRLSSTQELAYVIYHYPLLVLDGFVGESLLDFMREELGQGFLALKIEQWMKSGENPDEILPMILQESDYYTAQEIAHYRQQIADLRGKHPADYRRMKADELFSMRQYGRAVKIYQELLELPADAVVNETFRARVGNNLGSCYARMFRYDKAFEAYKRAYSADGNPEILSHLYCLTKLDPDLKLGERFKVLATEELRNGWDKDMEGARKRAENSVQVKQLDTLFSLEQPQREKGEMKLIKRWKQEYRTMA